ncbi:sulfite exporter TauE/SafE family protein [Vibrio sinensis]|uniref:Probable membrane transporter protein n=1 Tax=Vibrio sinensis TaxID=2302434 RepID=A0A3A6QCF5_9VIBR|nr:sulfite exporter TauE/SafE family protein [Vibrio sinensis]RJX69396.1 sulfite exporter TauE/SafE family protein [Vibrio sinensis]
MDMMALFFITFFAATLQAATGFGFGIIAVTAFLIIFQSTSAVQIVIIITFAMSIAHWFKIRSNVPVDLVKKLMIGCVIGYPIGSALFYMADINTLKIAVATLILLMTAQNGFERYRARNAVSQRFLPMNKRYCASVGTLSGAMASAMAMPGPVVVGYLTQCELDKNAIRAAVITTSTVSYAVSLVLQMYLFGVEEQTWEYSLMLLPATFAGLFFGEYISKFINPKLFKNITLLVLLISGVNILVTL